MKCVSTEPSANALRPRAFARHALGIVGADGALLVAFLGVLGLLVRSYGAQFRWVEGPILIAGGITVILLVFAIAARLPRVLRGMPNAVWDMVASCRRVMRDWLPFVVMMWAFESLETYTGVIRKDPIDMVLHRIDLQWFGVEPTVWAYKFHHPLLSDWMAFAYGSYFVMPMVIAVALSARLRRDDFREMSTAVVVQMGIGFVLFLLFPAGPPRYYPPLLAGPFQLRLHSYFGLLEFQQGAFDLADPVRTRSAFPSLHCSLGVLTLLYSWKFGDGVFVNKPRLYFWLCLPIVISLWLSTIYLRHHWVPDCIAGIALGCAANLIAARLRQAWPRPDPSVTRRQIARTIGLQWFRRGRRS